MSKVHLIGAALCAAAGFAALPQAASAAIWTTTYQGYVRSGGDFGTFGLPRLPGLAADTELEGLGFTATFVTDSSAAGPLSMSGPNSLDLRGLAGLVSASLTINNHTLLLGQEGGAQILSDNGIVQTTQHVASVYLEEDGYSYFGGLTFFVSGQGDGDFNTLPAGAIGGGAFGQGVGRGIPGMFDDVTNSELVVTSADMTYQAAVPEPQTWALLLLGFGAVGATLRRRGGRRLALR